MEDSSDRSLRERKKAKTRALIQKIALKLFEKQGYEKTTIEQIAQEAEVSPSTVFRYFPTKPDLVIYDAYDEPIIELFRSQPAELDSIQVMRNVLHAYFELFSDKEIKLALERARLMQEVPELRGAMFDEFARSLAEMNNLILERTDQAIDSDRALVLSGAVFGVLCAAWLNFSGEDWAENFKRLTEKGLDLLESGFGEKNPD